MGYIILALYLPLAEGQMNCAEAPTAAARIVCEQLHKWDANARVSQLRYVFQQDQILGQH